MPMKPVRRRSATCHSTPVQYPSQGDTHWGQAVRKVPTTRRGDNAYTVERLCLIAYRARAATLFVPNLRRMC